MAHESEFSNMEKLFVRSIQQFPPRENFAVRAAKTTVKYVGASALFGLAVVAVTYWMGQ